MVISSHIQSDTIKIWSKAYKVANENNYLNDYIFFLQLKAISKCGIIKNYGEVIGNNIGGGNKTIENKLGRLKRRGFISFEKINSSKVLHLNSYDKVYEIMGLKKGSDDVKTLNILRVLRKKEPSKKLKIKVLPFFNIDVKKLNNIQSECELNSVDYNSVDYDSVNYEKYELNSVDYNSVQPEKCLNEITDYDSVRKSDCVDYDSVNYNSERIKLHIQYGEIKKNLEQQEYVIVDKYIKECFIEEHGTNYVQTLSKGKKVSYKQGYLKFFKINKFMMDQLHMQRLNPLVNLDINYDLTISSRGISKMFGYKNSNSGIKIQKNLENAGLITIEKRLLELESCPTYEIFQNLKKTKYNGSNKVFFKRGAIWMNYTNKITVPEIEDNRNKKRKGKQSEELIEEEIEYTLSSESYLSKKISKYSNVRSQIAETITVRDMLNEIKGGTYEKMTNYIREKKIKKEAKSIIQTIKTNSLPVYTPSAEFKDGRGGDKEHNPTGLICIDIDDVSNVEETKLIVSKLPFVMSCFKSVSGAGLAVLIKIIPEYHESTFKSLEQYFSKINIKIDSKCTDIARTRFASYDKDLYLNKDSEIYNFKLTKIIHE